MVTRQGRWRPEFSNTKHKHKNELRITLGSKDFPPGLSLPNCSLQHTQLGPNIKHGAETGTSERQKLGTPISVGMFGGGPVELAMW